MRLILATVVVGVVLTGCGRSTTGTSCSTSAPCEAGLVCVDPSGRCDPSRTAGCTGQCGALCGGLTGKTCPSPQRCVTPSPCCDVPGGCVDP